MASGTLPFSPPINGPLTLLAAGTITAGQILKNDGTTAGSVVAAGAGEGSMIALDDAASGDTVRVALSGQRARVKIGATYSVANLEKPFKCDASGYAIPVTADKDRYAGFLIGSARAGAYASGDLAECVVNVGFYAV